MRIKEKMRNIPSNEYKVDTLDQAFGKRIAE
jgi:hypothetical protein